MDSPWLPWVRPKAGDLRSVAIATYRAWRDVRSGRLVEILSRRFASRTTPPATAQTPDLNARLAVFRSARPLVPIPRKCLHDCLALRDWLGPDGQGLTLVLGVSASPFAAHSWLQAGHQVIDDHPDSPSRYQPILHLC